MIFYLRNVVKYYSKVGDIKTIIIRCLKANRKKCMLIFKLKVVRDPCQKITLLLLKSKSVRVIVPESCF